MTKLCCLGISNSISCQTRNIHSGIVLVKSTMYYLLGGYMLVYSDCMSYPKEILFCAGRQILIGYTLPSDLRTWKDA